MTRSKLLVAVGAAGLLILVVLALIVVLGQRNEGQTGGQVLLTATLPGLATVARGGGAGAPVAQVTQATVLGGPRPTPAGEDAGSSGTGANPERSTEESLETSDELAATTTLLPGGPTPTSSEESVTANPTGSLVVATATPGPSPTSTTLARASRTPAATPAATATRASGSGAVPTATPLGQAATATPSHTPSPSATMAAGPADSISGRLILNGEPAPAGILLTLEDATFQRVAEVQTDADGRYRFNEVPASSAGYHVTFRWDLNQEYSQALVLGWIWIGPVPLAAGQALTLPDLNVARQGFGARQPLADSSISAAEVTAADPLTFGWRVHPQADAYWIDLLRGTALTPVWQSALIEDESVAFDGRLDNGSRWSPATYFWAVGGRGRAGEYPLVVYGHYNGLRVAP